jgi:hypothetical protein
MYPNLPTKKYDIIYLDPPWQYDPPNLKEKIVHARQKTDVQQLVRAPRRQHSRKPCIFRKLICDLFDTENKKQKIELFARKYEDSKFFDGYDVWGYESQHIDTKKRKKPQTLVTRISNTVSLPQHLT